MKVFYQIHSELNNFLHPIITSQGERLDEGEALNLIEQVLNLPVISNDSKDLKNNEIVSLLVSQDVLDSEQIEKLILFRKLLSDLIARIKNKQVNHFTKEMINGIQKLLRMVSQRLNPVKTQSVDLDALITKLNTFKEIDEVKKNNCLKIIKEYTEKKQSNDNAFHHDKEICQKLAKIFRPVANDSASKFDAEYEKLLLFCQVAYVFENNGIPQEHALKLTILFGNAKSAIEALKIYSEQISKKGELGNQELNLSGQYIHNACLFTLPQTMPKNWDSWRKHLCLNLSDVSYYIVLSNADQLELYYNDKLLKYNNLTTFEEVKNIGKIISDIVNIRKKIKNAQNKNVTAENIKLNELLIQLARYHTDQKIKLNDWPKDALIGLSKMYLETKQAHLQFLAKKGLSDSSLHEFENLDRSQAGIHIPNFENGMLELKSVEGYYFRKLNVATCLDDAALGACLGKLTSCCQSIGDAGHDCAVHGLTSPNGGFYVLIKGDPKSVKDTDKIEAQSWVWRGTSGELVFDSIELDFQGISEQDVIKAYNECIDYLVHSNENIPAIYVGNGATPSRYGLDIGMCAYPINYNGYRDSNTQKILHHQDMPYLQLIMRENLKNHEEIKSLSTKTLISELNAYLKREDSTFMWLLLKYIHSTNTEILSKLKERKEKEALKLMHGQVDESINFIEEDAKVILNKFDLFRKLDIDRVEESHAQNLKNIILTNLDFYHDLGNGRFKWSKEIINSYYDNGACLLLTGRDTMDTLLHRVAHDSDLLSHILKLMSRKDIIKALQIQNLDEQSVLSLSAKNSHSFRTILDIYKKENLIDELYWDITKQSFIESLFENDESLKMFIDIFQDKSRLLDLIEYRTKRYSERILDKLAKFPKSLKLILDLYTDEERLLKAVRSRTVNGKSILYYPESLDLIVDIYKDDELLFADLKEQDVVGNSAFHYSTLNDIGFLKITQRFTKEKIRELALLLNSNGDSVISKAILNTNASKIILDMFEKNEIESIITNKNKQNNMIFFEVVIKNPESISMMLSYFDEDGKLNILNRVDSYKRTPAHLAILNSNAKSLEIILQNIPIQKRLEFILSNKLMPMLGHELCMRVVLASLPVKDRLNAIQATNDFDGDTAMHSAAKNIRVLNEICDYLPKDDIKQVLKITNKRGCTPLHLAVINNQCIGLLIQKLPVNERLEAVLIPDEKELTVLECAINYPQSLRMIFESLSINDREHLTKYQNPNGDTLLHLFAFAGLRELSITFEYVAKETLFRLSKIKNKGNRSVLHMASNNPDALKLIIELYPEEERLYALTEKDNNGQTALHANNTYEHINVVLNALPPELRFNAVFLQNKNGDSLLFPFNGISDHCIYIFQCLPQSDRLQALKSRSGSGIELVYSLKDSIFYLVEILRTIPDNDLREAHEYIKDLYKYAIIPDDLLVLIEEQTERIDLLFVKEPLLLSKNPSNACASFEQDKLREKIDNKDKSHRQS